MSITITRNSFGNVLINKLSGSELLSEKDVKDIDFKEQVVLSKGFTRPPCKEVSKLLFTSKIHKNIFGNTVALENMPLIEDDIIQGAALVPIVQSHCGKKYAILTQKKELDYLRVPVGTVMPVDGTHKKAAISVAFAQTGLDYSAFASITPLMEWEFPHHWGGLAFGGKTVAFLAENPVQNDAYHLIMEQLEDEVDVVSLDCKKDDKLLAVNLKLFCAPFFSRHENQLRGLSGLYFDVLMQSARKVYPLDCVSKVTIY